MKDEIDFEKFFYNLTLTWFYTEPVLFQVFMTQKIEECCEMECGIRSGQGKIQYNPSYLMNLSQKQVKDEMRYELYRIMLRHPYRKMPFNADEELWYKASEITIKQVFLKDYDLEKNQSIEYYYGKLLRLNGNEGESDAYGSSDESDEEKEEAEKDGEKKKRLKDEEKESKKDSENKEKESEEEDQDSEKDLKSNCENENDDSSEGKDEGQKDSGKDEKNDSKDCGNENSETSENNDESGNDGKGSTGSENHFPQTALWKEDDLESISKLEAVLNNVGGKWGTIPKAIQEEIQRIQIKPIPQFIRILKCFRESVSFNLRCLTRMRPSRRCGFLHMGSRYKMLPKILVAVDVSASIDESNLMTFFAAVLQVFKTEIKEIELIQFDAAVEGKAVKFRKIPEKITRLGKGGTNFQCVIDYVFHHNNYDGLVIFTDGKAKEPLVPKNLHAKILWMTFAHGEIKEWMKKSGKTAWIYEDNEVFWVPEIPEM